MRIIPRWGIFPRWKLKGLIVLEISKRDRYLASQVSIMEYLQSHGYTCKRAGSQFIFPEIGDSFTVSPEKNSFYWFSHSIGGGPVQCLQAAFGMDEETAIKELAGDTQLIKPKSVGTAVADEKKEFVMPERADNCKKVYAYLINQRQLSPKIVSDFIKQGVLYQGFTQASGGKRENAVFLHLNESGKPCGADVQGLYSSVKFKGVIPHDDTDKGFVYNKGNPKKADTVYLFEAPIDLMSFVELHPEIKNAKFVAMGGLKPSIAAHYIDDPELKVVSCVDNDTAGMAFNNRILKSKMKQSLSLDGEGIKSTTCRDREPPIEYLEAEVNGRHCSFFLSAEDYRDANKTADIPISSAFLWCNRSNYTVNKECAEAGVKDFNELLCLRKSPSARDFVTEVRKMSDWANNVHNYVKEKNDANREQPIKT